MLKDESCWRMMQRMPAYNCIKNVNSEFVFVTEKVAALTGFDRPDEMLGLTDASLRCKAAESAEEFIAQDKSVMEAEKTIKIAGFDTYANGEFKMVVGLKSPWYSAQGELDGVFIQCIPADLNAISRVMINLNESFSKHESRLFDLSDNYPGLNLTRREIECLFFTLRGKSAHEIGQIIHVSRRTVEDYIRNIKTKMGCASKSELIEKSYHLGYFAVMPFEFFSPEYLTTSN
jgi:DNA-binding CsgD family transcriptional regulator